MRLYSGDGFDTAFRDEFSGPQWISDRMIRFRAASHPDDGWQLLIENGTATMLAGVTILANDLFILTDLEPASSARSALTSARGSDHEFVEVQVHDSSGRVMRSKAMDFRLEDQSARLLRVVVEANGIVIHLRQSGDVIQ